MVRFSICFLFLVVLSILIFINPTNFTKVNSDIIDYGKIQQNVLIIKDQFLIKYGEFNEIDWKNNEYYLNTVNGLNECHIIIKTLVIEAYQFEYIKTLNEIYKVVKEESIKFYNYIKEESIKFYNYIKEESIKFYNYIKEVSIKFYYYIKEESINFYNNIKEVSIKFYYYIKEESIKFYKFIKEVSIKSYIKEESIKFYNYIKNKLPKTIELFKVDPESIDFSHSIIFHISIKKISEYESIPQLLEISNKILEISNSNESSDIYENIEFINLKVQQIKENNNNNDLKEIITIIKNTFFKMDRFNKIAIEMKIKHCILKCLDLIKRDWEKSNNQNSKLIFDYLNGYDKYISHIEVDYIFVLVYSALSLYLLKVFKELNIYIKLIFLSIPFLINNSNNDFLICVTLYPIVLPIIHYPIYKLLSRDCISIQRLMSLTFKFIFIICLINLHTSSIVYFYIRMPNDNKLLSLKCPCNTFQLIDIKSSNGGIEFDEIVVTNEGSKYLAYNTNPFYIYSEIGEFNTYKSTRFNVYYNILTSQLSQQYCRSNTFKTRNSKESTCKSGQHGCTRGVWLKEMYVSHINIELLTNDQLKNQIKSMDQNGVILFLDNEGSGEIGNTVKETLLIIYSLLIHISSSVSFVSNQLIRDLQRNEIAFQSELIYLFNQLRNNELPPLSDNFWMNLPILNILINDSSRLKIKNFNKNEEYNYYYDDDDDGNNDNDQVIINEQKIPTTSLQEIEYYTKKLNQTKSFYELLDNGIKNGMNHWDIINQIWGENIKVIASLPATEKEKQLFFKNDYSNVKDDKSLLNLLLNNYKHGNVFSLNNIILPTIFESFSKNGFKKHLNGNQVTGNSLLEFINNFLKLSKKVPQNFTIDLTFEEFKYSPGYSFYAIGGSCKFSFSILVSDLNGLDNVTWGGFNAFTTYSNAKVIFHNETAQLFSARVYCPINQCEIGVKAFSINGVFLYHTTCPDCQSN
ncbi:hypothetical protein ACTFIY_010334 [Dictyostelium cf. discoideum]